MLNALSRVMYRRRRLVLMLSAAIVAASVALGIDAFPRLKNGGFEDPACESFQAKQVLQARLGRGNATLVVLYKSKQGLDATDAEFRDAVQASLSHVTHNPDVGMVNTCYNTGASVFLSKDKRETFATLALKGDEGKLLDLAVSLRPLLASDTLDVRVGGYPAIFSEMNEQSKIDLRRSELISLPIVAILLVFIFRSIVASLLPLVVGATTIFGGMAVLRIAAGWTDVSIFAANVVSMLGLGLAIDYSLFIVSRFREELAAGRGVEESLARTMDTAGRTILFSGVTVAISLLSLEVFPINFLRSVGGGGAAAVAIALIASLTLLPAVLASLGTRVDALPVGACKGAKQEATGSSFWHRMSLFVMRHAAVLFLITFALLLLLGRPFLRVRFAIPDARALPAGSESRLVAEALATRFPTNVADPIQVVVRTDGPVLDEAGISALFDYERALSQVPGVSGIESLVSFSRQFSKAQYVKIYAAPSRTINPIAAKLAPRFANGEHSVLTVLFKCDVNSPEAQALVRAIRAVPPPHGLQAEVGGTPADLMDFLHTVAVGVPRAVAIIIAVVFLLLFLMLGSVVIPLKAVILNVLSLSVSFGALVWIFQEGHLAGWCGLTVLGAIEGSMPVLVFAIAFGLSMDYEVFLLSRIKEHYDRTGDPQGAVARGVEKTGGIITSAALLLVVVIGSFATGRVVFVQQIGVGLGLAILVDATIVRMVLVPAAMQLMGKYNWWAPRRLAALYSRLGLSEAE